MAAGSAGANPATGGGGSPSGGTAGSGGGGGVAGSGGFGGQASKDAGMDRVAPMDDVAATLRGFREDIPCKYGGSHGEPLNACVTGDICWLEGEQNGGTSKWPSSITLGGDPAVTYEIVLRIRGVIEPKDYVNCAPQFTGPLHVCKGGMPGTTTFNPWSMKISDPPMAFWLNQGDAPPTHRVERIDGQFTIQAKGKAKIDFLVDTLNGGEIRNCTYVIDGIKPAPSTYDGNFLQLDVVSWKAL
jgi:hypothetical protein